MWFRKQESDGWFRCWINHGNGTEPRFRFVPWTCEERALLVIYGSFLLLGVVRNDLSGRWMIGRTSAFGPIASNSWKAVTVADNKYDCRDDTLPSLLYVTCLLKWPSGCPRHTDLCWLFICIFSPCFFIQFTIACSLAEVMPLRLSGQRAHNACRKMIVYINLIEVYMEIPTGGL